MYRAQFERPDSFSHEFLPRKEKLKILSHLIHTIQSKWKNKTFSRFNLSSSTPWSQLSSSMKPYSTDPYAYNSFCMSAAAGVLGHSTSNSSSTHHSVYPSAIGNSPLDGLSGNLGITTSSGSISGNSSSATAIAAVAAAAASCSARAAFAQSPYSQYSQLGKKNYLVMH